MVITYSTAHRGLVRVRILSLGSGYACIRFSGLPLCVHCHTFIRIVRFGLDTDAWLRCFSHYGVQDGSRTRDLIESGSIIFSLLSFCFGSGISCGIAIYASSIPSPASLPAVGFGYLWYQDAHIMNQKSAFRFDIHHLICAASNYR